MAGYRFPSSGSDDFASTAGQHDWLRRQISRRRFLAGSAATLSAATVPAVFPRAAASAVAAQPSGVHLAYGSDPTTEMAVTWQFNAPVAQPYLRLGSSPASLTEKIPAEMKPLATSFPGRSLLQQYYYQARASRLRPDTTYYYAISYAGNQGSLLNSFKTAPLPGSGKSFTFTAFGDQAVNAHARAMSGIVATQKPVFHLLAGDIAYADDDGRGFRPSLTESKVADVYHPLIWNNYLAQIAPVAAQIPWMVTMGNHDIEALYSPDGYGGQVSRFAFPGNGPKICPAVYSFTYENVAFLALDANDVSYEIPVNRGYSDGAQTAWIAAQLQRFRANPRIDFIVAFLHHCAYCTGKTHGSDAGVREEWSPLFDRYQVDLVINGHNHVYERTDPIRAGIATRAVPVGGTVDPAADGTTYLTVGGGGRDIGTFKVKPSYKSHVDHIAPIKTQYWTGVHQLVHEEVDWSRSRYEGYSLIAVDVIPGSTGGKSQMTIRTLNEKRTEIDRVVLRRTAGQASSPASELGTVAF